MILHDPLSFYLITTHFSFSATSQPFQLLREGVGGNGPQKYFKKNRKKKSREKVMCICKSVQLAFISKKKENTTRSCLSASHRGSPLIYLHYTFIEPNTHTERRVAQAEKNFFFANTSISYCFIDPKN